MLAGFAGAEAPEGGGQGHAAFWSCRLEEDTESQLWWSIQVMHVEVWQAHLQAWAYIFLSFVTMLHSALMQCILPAGMLQLWQHG